MKKYSMLFVAIMSLACVSFFSSCKKEKEVTAKIKMEGTVKLIVRGYSIGLSGNNRKPNSVEKNIFTPVQGYKVTLANGKIITTDSNGIATITLESGEYLIDNVTLPAGYFDDYEAHYSYTSDRYEYTLSAPDEGPYYFGYFSVSPGYQEVLVQLYRN